MRSNQVEAEVPSRSPGAWALLRTLLMLAVILAAPRALRADDDEWKARIDKRIAGLETLVATIDAQKPATGAMAERVRALNARIAAQEKASGIEPGNIVEKDDLRTLTEDVVSLDSRFKALVARRSAPNDPPKKPDAKPEPPEKPEPKEPAEPQKQARGKWPEQVAFAATAKIVYQETGEWFTSDTYGLENDFLMNGYAGSLSFSLRASGLVHDVASATIRVAVRMRAPFDRVASYHTYDVVWPASHRVFGDGSLKTWLRHADVYASGPIQWIAGPSTATAVLDAEAYLLSVTLPDGTKVDFAVPSFATR